MRRMVTTQRPGLINNNDDGGGGRPGARAESIGTCFTTGGYSSSWNACFMYINSHLEISRSTGPKFQLQIAERVAFPPVVAPGVGCGRWHPFAKPVTRGR